MQNNWETLRANISQIVGVSLSITQVKTIMAVIDVMENIGMHYQPSYEWIENIPLIDEYKKHLESQRNKIISKMVVQTERKLESQEFIVCTSFADMDVEAMRPDILQESIARRLTIKIIGSLNGIRARRYKDRI
jgi:hypothetical protein